MSKKEDSSLGTLARSSSMGIEFVGTVLAGGALGYLADSKLDTAPWLMVTGVFLFSFVGLVRLVLYAQRMNREQ